MVQLSQPSMTMRKTIALTRQAFVGKVRSDHIRSVTQSYPTLCNPMNRSTPGLPVRFMWDVANVVLRGKFISIISYIKKLEGYQVSSQTLQLKDLEKEQINCK